MVILLIITPYSPAQTPNTLRWKPIVNILRKKGYEVHVLTSKWPDTPTYELIDGVHIHRTGYNTLLDAAFKLVNKKPSRATPGKQRKNTGVFRTVTEKLVSMIWRNLYWPDGSVLFLKPGKRKVKQLLQKYNIEHVISVGLPFTCHLIGKEAKQYQSSINWIMDIEDPFAYSDLFRVNNRALYKQKNFREEGLCLKIANNIVITNSIAKQKYISHFNIEDQKLNVIQPLIEIQKLPKQLNRNSRRDRVQLAYFGSFYEGVRNPKPFFDFLTRLIKYKPEIMDKIDIRLYGQQSHFSRMLLAQYSFKENFFYIDNFLERDEMYNKMNQADILLNFANLTDYHLPSKVVEFLFFQKPVINITQKAKDSSYLFLKNKLELFNLNLSDDIEYMTNAFIRFVIKDREQVDISFQAIESYSEKAIAQEYLRLIEKD